MATLYRITNWSTTYETSETRKLDRLRWVPVPNKHDGLSFKKISSEKDGAEIFAAWILILQIASKCPIRGQLSTDSAGQIPLSPGDMGLKTGYPGKLFERALIVLTKPEIGWIYTENANSELNPIETALNTGQPELSPAVLNGRNRKKGREGKAVPPTADFVSLIPSALNTQEFINTWLSWVKDRKDRKKPITEKAAELQFGKCEKWGVDRAIYIIKNAIEKGWQGLYEPNESKAQKQEQPQPRPTPRPAAALPTEPNDPEELARAAAKLKTDTDAMRLKAKKAAGGSTDEPLPDSLTEMARKRFETQDGVFDFLTRTLRFSLVDLSRLTETYDLEYVAEKVALVKKRFATLPNPAAYFNHALEKNFQDLEVAGETDLDRQNKELARIKAEEVVKIEELLKNGGTITQAEYQRLAPDRRNELEYDEQHFIKHKEWVYRDPQADVSQESETSKS